MPRRTRAKAPPHIPPAQERNFSIRDFLVHPHFKTHRIAVVAHLIIVAIAAPFIINELSKPYAPAKAVQVTTTTYATVDSMAYAGAATSNYNLQNTLVAQAWSTTFAKRAYVKFDLSYIPAGATINVATLKLYQSGSYFSPSAQSVHRLTTAWTSGVTWNKYDGTNNWTTAGGDYDGTATDSGTKAGAANGTEVTFNVATDVAAFAAGTYTNNGWVIKMTTESGSQKYMTYHALENLTAGYRPQLTVTYTEATGGPTVSADSATQKSDGTRAVDVTVTVSDSGNADSKLAVYYVAQTGASCGDDETYITKATIDTTGANVSASVTPNPDVSNSNAYQIGTVTPVKTTSENTVQFDWLSNTDVPSVVGSYCLGVMGYNGTADSATSSVSVAIENSSESWNDIWENNVTLDTIDGSFLGEAADDNAGSAVASAGDVNGDGYDDFLVAAYYEGVSNLGKVYVIFGTSSAWSMDTSLVSAASASYKGTATGELAGSSMAGVGDVNSDGYDDFVIGAPWYDNANTNVGRVFLVLGKASGWALDTNLTSADAWYYGEGTGESKAGYSVGAAGDVNNDGFDDFVVGAIGDDQGATDAGMAYIIFGKASGWSTNVSLSTADASYTGEGGTSYAGSSVSGAGDVNGDGIDDIIIGAMYHAFSARSYAGETYVVFGKTSGWAMDVNLSTADASYGGEVASDLSGAAVAPAGDVNNDGYADFLIGAYGNDDGGTNAAGQVYLIRGKASSWTTNVDLSSADSSFLGEAAGDYAGFAWPTHAAYDGTSFHSDLNGDGYDDIIIGSQFNNENTNKSNHGQSYVIFGTSTNWGMDVSLSTADASFWGETAEDQSGYAVGTAGDVNSDGADDLLIGAPYNDAVASASGQVYLVLSPGSSNNAPSMAVNSAAQKTDGSGTVDISVDVGDTESNDAKMSVYYALRTGGTCGDETFSTKATLDETAENVSASVTPKPDVENDNAYQVGTATAIKTSATNTLQFDWSSLTNLSSGDAAYCLKFTANDTVHDSTAQYQSVTIDNVDPTSPGALTMSATSTVSVTFTLGSQTVDTNFTEYKIHYRTGSSGALSSDSALTSSTLAALGSISYSGATTAQLTGLATSTQYVARIFAYDAYGNTSSSTSELAFYTLATAPGTPTVSVSSTATSSLVIVLDQSTNPSTVTYSLCKTSDGATCDASGYVQADGSLGASAVWQTYTTWGGSSGVSVTGLSSNTSYRFLAKARNGDSVETAFSSASTATVTLAGPVTGVTVTNATNTTTLQLTLSWTNADQTGMKIERDNSCDGSYDLTLYNSTSANDTSPTTTSSNISANTCYAFRFSSYNSGGTVNSTHTATTAQITTPPAQPQSVAASAADTTSITWGWDAVTGASSYNIYNNSTGALLGTATAPTVSYSQSGLSANTQYTVIVRAVSANDTGIASSAASTYTDTTAPSGLSHSNQTTSAIQWTWTNSGQSSFYARDKNNTGNTSDWTTNAYWDHSSLAANTAYTMEVKAKNASNEETAYSEITRYTSQNAPSGLTFSSVTASGITVTADGTFTNQGVASSLIHFDNGAGTTQDVTSGASWSNSGLNPNTQYTYTVYAANGDGDQTSSVNGSKYTLANTPGTIVATAASASSLSLALDRNSNPVGTSVLLYETTTGIYIDTVAKTLTGDANDLDSFTNWGTVAVTGLSPNTAYQFTAVASNGDSVVTASSTTSTAVYTLANTPGTPTISNVAATSVTVSIDSNSNPASTEYAVYETQTSQYVNGSLALASATPTWQTTSTWATLTVTGLTPNTLYQFGVAARNGASVSTVTTTATSTYSGAAVPSSLTVATDSDSQITATWTANSNPAGTEYYVENVTQGTNSGWITQLSWASASLQCGQSYLFRVHARNASGTESLNTDGVTGETTACRGGGGVSKSPSRSQAANPQYVFEGISVIINAGADSTSSQTVNLSLNGGNSPHRMMVSTRSDFAGVGQEPYQATKTMTLPPGDGLKTVYARFYSTNGLESDVVSDSITLATTVILIDPPVVTAPTDNQIFEVLPFEVVGTALSGANVTVQIAGTEYRVSTVSSTQFSVTVLDQLTPGPYTIYVSQTNALGTPSSVVERHITYKPPVPVEEVPVEEPVVEEPVKEEPKEEPIVEPEPENVQPKPTRPPVTPPKETPVTEPEPETPEVASVPSPTVQEVQEIVSQATEREAFMLVMRDHTADFNKQQVNGIEVVQGESLRVLMRPAEQVKSITARLYNLPGQTNAITRKESSSFWDKLRQFFTPNAQAANENAPQEWIEGYVFAKKSEMVAFEQTMNIPTDLPAGKYKLVITMNGTDGSRNQLSKVIHTIPEGVVSNTSGRTVGQARVSVYRQSPSGTFELWQGSAFGEENPHTIRTKGAYSVHVPAGQYYIVVDAPLHDIYQSGIIVMKEPGIINADVLLKSHGPDIWYRFVSWVIELFQ